MRFSKWLDRFFKRVDVYLALISYDAMALSLAFIGYQFGYLILMWIALVIVIIIFFRIIYEPFRKSSLNEHL